MLEIRLNCENCDKYLPNDCDNAMRLIKQNNK